MLKFTSIGGHGKKKPPSELAADAEEKSIAKAKAKKAKAKKAIKYD